MTKLYYMDLMRCWHHLLKLRNHSATTRNKVAGSFTFTEQDLREVRGANMPENINVGRSARSKRVLVGLGFLQMVLGLVLLFLWVGQKDQKDTTSAKLFGIVSAASNLLSGCTSLAAGIGASEVLTVLGKGSAVISCLCSIIAFGIQSNAMAIDSNHGASNPELIILPFVCFVVNILEMACYSLTTTDNIQHHIIYDSRIGVFQVPEHQTNVPDSNMPGYGSFATVDIESQRHCKLPPSYSDPPAYSSER